jgi:hypothetical protein
VNDPTTDKNMPIRPQITTLLLLSTAALLAQEPVRDPATGKYTYQAVVEVPGASDSTLFARGASWFEDAFKTQQLDLRNATDGKLAHAGGSFPVAYMYQGYRSEFQIAYTASVAVRSGRYQYTFTDFLLSQSSAGTTENITLEGYCDRAPRVGKKVFARVRGEILAQVDDSIKKRIESLGRALSGAAGTDDW